jgi:hypothetical protein
VDTADERHRQRVEHSSSPRAPRRARCPRLAGGLHIRRDPLRRSALSFASTIGSRASPDSSRAKPRQRRR